MDEKIYTAKRLDSAQEAWETLTIATAVFHGDRPEIVVLCGSTKFKEQFETETKRLGLEGKIVLSVSMFGHAGDLTPEEVKDGHPVKTGLDKLHLRKIDLADCVHVRSRRISRQLSRYKLVRH